MPGFFQQSGMVCCMRRALSPQTVSRAPIGRGSATRRKTRGKSSDAPVSTRPRTGMPSRVSWPVTGGPTAHPTGVTLPLGDPPRSLNAPGGSLGCFLPQEARESGLLVGHEVVSWPLLAQQELQQGASGAAIGEVTLFIAQEATGRPPVWLCGVEW